MYMNSYIYEKLAKQHHVELEQKSRAAWMWIETNNKLNIVQQLTGSWKRKKAAVVSEAVNEVCCGCCVVTL